MKGLLTYIGVILVCSVTSSYGQTAALPCNGQIYRVIENHKGTAVQTLSLNDAGTDLEIVEKQFYKKVGLNGICFKPDDGHIYGLEIIDGYDLIRIDGNYNLTFLKKLELPQNLFFVSSDITPDGKSMIMLGFGKNEEQNLLVRIDLTDPEYSFEMIPLKMSVEDAENVIVADIAFHPTTGALYGFDQRLNKIVEIDVDKRTIYTDRFPRARYDIGVVPSIFFTNDGRLYAIGGGSNGFVNNRLFEFDIANKTVEQHSTIKLGGSQDACSCPFSISLELSVHSDLNYVCTDVQFQLRVINRSGTDLEDFRLSQTLPQGIVISDIIHNPFPGIIETINEGRTLVINDMDIAKGVDTFIFRAKIDQEILLGFYETQAVLEQLEPLTTGVQAIKTYYSDNPTTAVNNDPTPFIIDKFSSGLEDSHDFICQNEQLVLSSNILGAQSYIWNTGERSSDIVVKEEGLYEVIIESDCETTSKVFEVTASQLNVNIGDDRVVERGQEVALHPQVDADNNIEHLLWKEGDTDYSISCYTCLNTKAYPLADKVLTFEVEDIHGCISQDEIFIKVNDFTNYTPNAFSPNADGRNEKFYIHTKSDFPINEFQVYDRWGNAVFSRKNGLTNDENFSWDGTTNGHFLQPDVFVWKAELQLFDGSKKVISGDVTLVR